MRTRVATVTNLTAVFFALDLAPLPLARLWETLSADERARARRYRFALHRDRFIAARGMVRRLLAQRLSIPAAAMRFVYGRSGKPALAPEQNTAIAFNLSHSAELGVCVFGAVAALGVDVEAMRDEPGARAAVWRCLDPQERAAVCALAPERQLAALYGFWTCKEAVMKATGRGFGLDPLQIGVVAPDAPRPRLSRLEDAPALWRLRRLTPPRPGFAAVVAVRRPFAGTIHSCWVDP